MTLQEWKEIEEKLNSPFSMVELNCDGYTLQLALRRIAKYNLVIMVYVNGVFKGEWLINDCEERRRFFRPIVRSLYTQKEKKKFSKISKKVRKEYGCADLDKKLTYYAPYWTSFNSLKRHLIKNNNSIELIRRNKDSETG